MTADFHIAWSAHDFAEPRSVGVTFHDLHEETGFTPSLFDNLADRELLNGAVDRVNQKFGKNSVYIAALENVKDHASEKIAFNKTWLFQEGKGDNDWSFGG